MENFHIKAVLKCHGYNTELLLQKLISKRICRNSEMIWLLSWKF